VGREPEVLYFGRIAIIFVLKKGALYCQIDNLVLLSRRND
jgi:hypothetical protein